MLPVKGVRRPKAFDHGMMASAPGQAPLPRPPSAKALARSTNWTLDPSGGVRSPTALGKRYECKLPSYELSEAGKDEPEATPPAKPSAKRLPVKRPSSNTSPDGKWTALVKGHNIRLKENATGQERLLTTQGTADDGFGSVCWSPDSSRLVAVLHPEGRSAARSSSSSRRPRDQIYPEDCTPSTTLNPATRWRSTEPHLFTWSAISRKYRLPTTSSRIPGASRTCTGTLPARSSFSCLTSGATRPLRLIGIDGETGQARAIVDETSTTFVDYNGKFFLEELSATGELIWMSQRDGWNHLYLIDQKSGTVKNQITRGPWLVRKVDRVDGEKREIWFQAGGIHADQDPYHVHFCRVNFDGTGLVHLTAGDGTHVIRYSPGGRFYLDTYSMRVDLRSRSRNCAARRRRRVAVRSRKRPNMEPPW